jgi:CheY-like chemotaxis protein
VEKTSELRVVEVVPESRSLVVTLVTPDGYRVEGVSGQAVRTLLEALR